MTINDDGLGFDPESISQGHGLRVMDERVRSIGGQMLVKTSRDHGTTITVEIEGSGPTEEEIL
jgi:signal transduction histidine kinase